MLKKVLLGATLCLAIGATTASAQTPRISITGLFGYTFADGVSGDGILAGDGNIYNRIDPQDSVHFGFSGGVFVNPQTEIGFLWRRQMTKLDVSGTNTRTLGDQNIDNYHGYFAYYFGDPDARVNPYFLGGFGATHFSSVDFSGIAGTPRSTLSVTQFSTVWGAGLRLNANEHFGFKVGFNWTPAYIKSDATGWWCDPYWGCYVVGNAQYANQFELMGGVTFRFGG
jgi:hypothetical protein